MAHIVHNDQSTGSKLDGKVSRHHSLARTFRCQSSRLAAEMCYAIAPGVRIACEIVPQLYATHCRPYTTTCTCSFTTFSALCRGETLAAARGFNPLTFSKCAESWTRKTRSGNSSRELLCSRSHTYNSHTLRIVRLLMSIERKAEKRARSLQIDSSMIAARPPARIFGAIGGACLQCTLYSFRQCVYVQYECKRPGEAKCAVREARGGARS